MAQKLELSQLQREQQLLKLSPLQLLVVDLTELSVADMEKRVKNEIDENDALETRDSAENSGLDNENSYDTGGETNENDDYDGGNDTESTPDEYANYGSIDDVPDYIRSRVESENTEVPIGDSTSFVEDLIGQMMDYDLTDHQKSLVEFLIYSLDERGYIDSDLYRIADEMTFNHGIETDEFELEDALHILQQFDPAGIGARNTQECLLLQIQRKLDALEPTSVRRRRVLELEKRIVKDEYDSFINKNIGKLENVIEEEPSLIHTAFEDIKKLTIHPGLPLCESSSDRSQTIIPDFIVETDFDGQVTFRLNSGDIPQLRVSRNYLELADKYKKQNGKMSRSEREALEYTHDKLDRAQMFIDAIRQRQQTLNSTMKAIIDLQHDYFVSQDENDIHDLILKDVAEKTHLDISTISRVCKSKYVAVNGRIHRLSFFFKHSRANSEGEKVESNKVMDAIRLIVDNEDKSKPYSDDQIVGLLKKAGINIKIRTVNKYRNEMAIPTANNRRNY